MSGFLGGEAGEPTSTSYLPSPHVLTVYVIVSPVPVWDIQTAYQEDDVQNMLVSNTRLGESLARSFSTNEAGMADKTVVLMYVR